MEADMAILLLLNNSRHNLKKYTPEIPDKII
jgi:hypothetical protein